MATFKTVQTYQVEVNNSDNDNRAYDIHATARVDYGTFAGLDGGEIRRLPDAQGADPMEGDILASFSHYGQGGSLNVNSGELSLAEAAAIADGFRDEVASEVASDLSRKGGEA